MSQGGKVRQAIGSVESLPSGLTTLGGNGEIIPASGSVVRVDAGGSARTGTIMGNGQPGQICYVINEGGEKISFNATQATANVNHDGSLIAIPAGKVAGLVWDDTNGLWCVVNEVLTA